MPYHADLSASVRCDGRRGRLHRFAHGMELMVSGDLLDLRPIEIIGGQTIDPKTQDFFFTLMEYRHDLKQELKSLGRKSQPEEYDRLDNMQRTVKTIANATAYGIAVQVNVTEDEEGKSDIHTEQGSFTVSNRSMEVPGEHFNPAVAVFVTAAARLILAITEHLSLTQKFEN